MEPILTALDPVITTLRPHFLPYTTSLPPTLRDPLISLLGSHCYQTLIHDLSPTPACATLLLSKALGVAIITVSSIVKLPQLLKLLSSRSATGLSFSAYALETAAYGISLAYGARSGFPFSTYGESALIAAQNVGIAALILHLGGRGAGAAAWLAAVASAGYALADQRVVGMEMLGRLMAGAGVLGVASKVPQIWTIWKNGGTGQLSSFAVGLGFSEILSDLC